MATANTNPRRNSGSNGASPAMPFLGFQPMDWLPAGRPHVSEAATQASLTGLDIMESWLTASRQMIDLWRESVREQQDAMLAMWRQQVVNTFAHDLQEETETSPAARRKPRARQPAARSGHARAATRH